MFTEWQEKLILVGSVIMYRSLTASETQGSRPYWLAYGVNFHPFFSSGGSLSIISVHFIWPVLKTHFQPVLLRSFVFTRTLISMNSASGDELEHDVACIWWDWCSWCNCTVKNSNDCFGKKLTAFFFFHGSYIITHIVFYNSIWWWSLWSIKCIHQNSLHSSFFLPLSCFLPFPWLSALLQSKERGTHFTTPFSDKTLPYLPPYLSCSSTPSICSSNANARHAIHEN